MAVRALFECSEVELSWSAGDCGPNMPGDPDFERAQQAVFDELGLAPESRFLDLDAVGTTVHVLDDGPDDAEGSPILFLHSGGTFGALFAPLLARIEGTRTIAMDRPGFGLSDEFEYRPATYRQTIIDTVVGALDELGIEQVDLAGNSNGGYWSLVFALARPERVRRIALLGSLPALPGTSPPLPLRLYTVPVVNRLLGGMFLASSRDDVIEKYDIFGEGETIQQYPGLIRAIQARDAQPHAHELDIGEMTSLLTLRGWRASNRLRETELRDVRQPALVIWGEDDPLGTPGDVRETIETIPDARLESLDGGHVPWLGNPEVCARHLREFRA